MKEAFTAWAIDSQSSEGHGLLGRYYFAQIIPVSIKGCRLSLFPTRKIAREHLAEMRRHWVSENWRPKVVKVNVIVEVIK